MTSKLHRSNERVTAFIKAGRFVEYAADFTSLELYCNIPLICSGLLYKNFKARCIWHFVLCQPLIDIIHLHK